MPSSDQIKTLLLIRSYCKNNILSQVPKDILRQLIGQYHRSNEKELKIIAQLPIDNPSYTNDDSVDNKKKNVEHSSIVKSMLNNNPDVEISVLLHYVAFGSPTQVREILAKNPELLFKTGDVLLPSGDTVLCVAPYELLLGCGDHYHDMHTIFNDAFQKIENGEKEQERQFKRYQPYIKNIMKFYAYKEAGNDVDKILSFFGHDKRRGEFNQTAYDFSRIINVIIKSSLQDVQIALDKKFECNTKLNKELKKFKQDFSPKVFTSPCIYFNYNNLYVLEKLINDKWGNLIVTKDDHQYVEKCLLVCQQILGLVMRGLPACELQAYAESLYDLMHVAPHPIIRTFKFKNDDNGGSIPISALDDSFSGLGFSFSLGNDGKPIKKDNLSCPDGTLFKELITSKCTELGKLDLQYQEQSQEKKTEFCNIF